MVGLRLLALVAVGLLLAWAVPPAEQLQVLRGGPGPTAGPELVVAVTGLAAWALALWLAAGLLLTLGSTAGGRAGRACTRALRYLAPVAVRRLLAVAVGASVAVGAGTANAAPAAGPAPSAPPAVAAASGTSGSLDWPVASDDTPTPATSAAPSGTSTAPTAAPTPASPAAAPTPAAPPTPGAGPTAGVAAPPAARGETVVVRPGDTLWGLAAAHLPPPVTAARTAVAWPAWWAANRAVVGDDPGLLHPGQRLVVRPSG